MARAPDGPTSVYLYRDEAGLAAYIGITCNPTERRKAHRRYSWWCEPEAEMTVLRKFERRDEAEAEERRLIEKLNPPFNVRHNDPSAVIRRPGWVEVKQSPPRPITGEAAERAEAAAESHRRMHEYYRQRDEAIAERDRLVRELRAEDPAKWSYATLAREVGCSESLIAAIVKGRTGRRAR